MTIPLIVLAVLSAVGGFLNLPEVLGGNAGLAKFLEPVFAGAAAVRAEGHLSHSTEYILMGVSAVAALLMAVYAYRSYVSKGNVPVGDHESRTGLAKLSYHKFYVDEIYDRIITKPLNQLSVFFFSIFDKKIIDGFVNYLGKGASQAGSLLRLLQQGNVGYYIFYMVIGIIAILAYGLFTI